MTRKTPYRLAIALALVLMVAMGSQRVVEVEAHAGDSFALDKANYSMTEGETLIVRIDRTVVSPPADSHVVTLAVDSGTAVRFSHFGFNSAPPDLKFSFGPIDTNRTLEIFAVDDGDPNADRQFTIRIASVTNSGAFESTASVVTIRDNDTPRAAQVTGISPESGNTGGGTEVTISGFDFTGTNCTGPDLGVAFGAVEATSCQVISDTTIKAIAPSQDAGGVSIRVTNDDGLGPSPDTADDNFEYVAGPAISGVMPSSGTEGGVAQIRGTGLGPNPTVTFGSAVATISGSPTSTQINVIIPAPPAGTLPIPVRVKVTVSGVDSPDTGADDFTYAAVTVTGLSPSTGPEGTAVVITGTGFTTTSTVKFGTVTADVVGTPTPTSITAVAPVPLSTQRPHTVDVSVTSGDVVSANTGADNFQYVGVTLTSLTPVAGPPGTVVTIAGSGFRGTPIVKFGTTTATTVTEVSDTSLKVVAPPHAAGKVDVTVQSGDVVAPTPTDTTKDDFTYTAGVEVTEVSPKKGPTAGGNTVTITGSGFAPTGGATVTVLFGTTPGTVVTVTSNTQLTVTAPARGAGTISVTVTVNGVSNPDTDGDDYTYADLPVITLLTPSTSVAGQTTIVTITGANFTTASKVLFGELEAVFTIGAGGTEITAATPSSAAAGTVDVFVVNPAGTSVAGPQTAYIFTGTGGTPAVTALSPSSTTINTSGVEVMITGVNFSQGATVKFGTETAAGVQVLTSTTIKAVAPLRTTGGTVDVTVTTGAGTSSPAGTGNDFTYGNPSGSTLTVTYNLYVRFTLITWDGKENMPVGDALRGLETPTDLPATNNVTSSTTAVFSWSATGAGCTGSGACWLGYFPSGVGVPGANNLGVLVRGVAYWVAVVTQTNWTTRQGP